MGGDTPPDFLKMANFAELKILMADWFNEKPHLANVIPIFLKYGQQSLQNKIVLPEMQTHISGYLFEGQKFLNLPTDLLHIDFLLIEDGARHNVSISYDKEQYIEYFNKENTMPSGIPTLSIYGEGGKLYFNKSIAKDCKFILGYYRTLPYFYPEVVQIPTGIALNVVTGSLQAGNYVYRITAFNGWGETLPSSPVNIHVGNNSGVEIKWNRVNKAIGYKVYGRSSNSQLHIATVYTNMFIDRGHITPSGSLPSKDTTQPTDFSTNAWSIHAEKALLYASLVEAIPYLEGEPRSQLWIDKLNLEIMELKKYKHINISSGYFLE